MQLALRVLYIIFHSPTAQQPANDSAAIPGSEHEKGARLLHNRGFR